MVRFQPTADQMLFARTVRELLEKECPPEAARAGFSRDRWTKLCEAATYGDCWRPGRES